MSVELLRDEGTQWIFVENGVKKKVSFSPVLSYIFLLN